MSTPPPNNPPAGFYDDGNGRQRWFDGIVWTDHYQAAAVAPPVQQASPVGPMTSANLNVKREVIYNRQQKGHSLILHLIFGGFLLYIPTIYYAVSPNHYFHA
jgi:hypothetical protein